MSDAPGDTYFVTSRANAIALSNWRKHMQAIGRSPGTIEQYESYLSRFLDPQRRAFAVTIGEIERWISEHPKWSAPSRRTAANALGSFYGWAADRGLIEADPTLHLERARTRRPVPKPTPDDVLAESIANASGDDRREQVAAQRERAAIVAWLSQSGMFLSGVADLIDRGEHLKNPDNSLHVSETGKECLRDE